MEPLSGLDQVRGELRRLGYFDSGLDRFVLAEPSLLGVSLRVGLAAGVLLGPLLTLLAWRLDRKLAADRLDLLVLGLYASLFLGIAAGLLALLAGVVAGVTSKRVSRAVLPRLSRYVGFLWALVGVLYLVLWFRSHAPLGGSLAARAAAVLGGLLLSVLLARFGSLSAVAVLSASGMGEALGTARLARARLLPLLLLTGVGIALAVVGVGTPEVFPAPNFAVVPTGLRIRLLGIDGLEGRMAEGVEMPHLRALLTQGARGRLKPEPETIPALVWTSIATGRGPEAHGILATDSRRLAGMKTAVPLGSGPLSSALASALDLLRISRREPPTAGLLGAKPFWSVASEKGLRVGVVNWWATWPAQTVNGFLVSDRAFFRIEKGGAPDREVYPPQAFGTLESLKSREAESRAKQLDSFEAGALLALEGQSPPDLEAVYLPGLDIFTMQTLGDSSLDLATLDARMRDVQAYHAFVDTLIGEVLRKSSPSEVTVLIGDPGRYSRRSAEAEGILAICGGPIRKTDLGWVSERDIAPTVLHLMGLPISRELSGKVLEQALEPAFRAARPLRTVPTYGAHPREALPTSGFDPEVVEALRSLGYVR